MEDVIITRNLCKRFRSIEALKDLSLSVAAGSVYAMLGPNGAGKTTALDLLVNLQTPTEGEALILGTNSRDLQGHHFQSIGYVSEAQEYPDWMTVDYLFSYLKPFYPNWDGSRAAELIEQFRLPTRQRLNNFSRGMRMKARLASSMAFHPKLLILDEPFSGLDPLTRDELIEALLDNDPQPTVILSSHDLAEIETFVTHVGYLSDGQLLFSEERAELSDRFREITVTLAKPGFPDPWPEDWVSAEVGHNTVRFVETRFDASSTKELIAAAFADVKATDIAPMSLRSIFLSMARSGQRHQRS